MFAATALAVGVAGGLALDRVSGPLLAPSDESGKGRKIAYWVAPMDPNYRRDAPGKSPMGMDLIPVYEGETPGGPAPEGATNDADGVRVSPATMNTIGVRVGVARLAEMGAEVRTVGSVTQDEDATSHVHVRAEGWIEDLRFRSLGAQVRKGDVLFAFFSRELAAASWEYVRELQRGADAMTFGARAKLEALGISDEQIDEIRKSGKPAKLIKVHAPRDGVLVQLGVGEGMFIRPDQTIMTLSDLTSIWVIADVVESQIARVTPGMEAEATLAHLPGRVWRGTVDYIYPELDPATRTARVRLRFANPDLALRPNMFADVTLKAPPRTNVLTVPTEAVIRVQGGDRVVLDLGEGRFRSRPVTVGERWNGLTEIRDGLAQGDRIVLSGQFLIDSEASLLAGLARMEDPAPEARHQDHPDHGALSEVIAETKATLNAIDLEKGVINVSHEPIPVLGWPAMTMDFSLSDGVDRATLPKAGSAITLGIGKAADGGFVAVRVTSGQGEGAR
ncbi:hemolysin D [Pararhodospirillum oryzae]|uniref:Hemolysin D n=1 Tax=Pararhodospirillum oryzae TaxID=478448 RepID=A0A512H7M2_9PROT|nr:hemolysin D [Pararhodospirillum oryzae]